MATDQLFDQLNWRDFTRKITKLGCRVAEGRLPDDVQIDKTAFVPPVERQVAPGYRTERRYVVRVPTSRVMGNIAIGGLIGLAVDAASGANNELAPGYLDVALTPSDEEGVPRVAHAAPAAKPGP